MIVNAIRSFFGFPQANAPPVILNSRIANESAQGVGWREIPWADARFVFTPVDEITLNEGNTMNMFNLLKAIYEIVKLVEAALPDSPGKAKFDAAMELVNTQAGAAVSALPVVETFINGAVSVLNILGTFKKKV